jgi:hypothetical protein
MPQEGPFLSEEKGPPMLHPSSFNDYCLLPSLFVHDMLLDQKEPLHIRLFSTLLLSAGVVGCLFSPLISTRLLCQTAIVPSFHTHFIMNVPFRDARLNLDTCQSN